MLFYNKKHTDKKNVNLSYTIGIDHCFFSYKNFKGSMPTFHKLKKKKLLF